MKLKKIIAGFAASMLICSFIPSSSFAAMTPAGDLLETDIGAYINGCKIPSYNVNGYTAIVAEDLISYGFDVVWNNTSRTVTVSRSAKTEFSGILLTEGGSVQVGKKVGAAYFTDIRTFVNGITVLSYNIGGKTAIFFDALKMFGTVNFDEASRSVTCSIDGLSYKKPLVTITDSEKNDDIYVSVPTGTTAEYYSNGFVPSYEYVTGVKLIKSVEKSNSYISYIYDNYDEFAVEKYVEYIVDKAGFIYTKIDQKENSLIYYYTKGNEAMGIEVDNLNNTVTITCKK